MHISDVTEDRTPHNTKNFAALGINFEIVLIIAMTNNLIDTSLTISI